MHWNGNNLPDLKERDIVFDLDGTLLLGDIGESVFLHLHIKDLLDGVLSAGDIISEDDYRSQPSAAVIQHYFRLFEAGQFDLAYRYTAEVMSHFEDDTIQEAVRSILDQGLGKKQLRIPLPDKYTGPEKTITKSNFGAAVRQGLFQLAAQFREKGARLWIVSASPQSVVDACGDVFDIPKQRLFGAVPDQNGKHPARFPWKSGKAEVLNGLGIHQPLYVFGNGLEDLDMLRLAEFPVVMGDGHPQLVEQARENDWLIFAD